MLIFNNMGWFSTNKYSTAQHYLAEIEIKKLVSEVSIKTLHGDEEAVVERSVVARRLGDGKISLQQIYETLKILVSQGKISKIDRDKLMLRFKEFFTSKGY